MNKRFKYKKVTAVSIGHLFNDIFAAFLSPVIPVLTEKLGITVSMAGFLDIIRNAPSILNPFIAFFVEKLRAKYIVIFMPAVTSISMSLLGIATNYAVLVILILTAGISSTLFHIPAPVMIKNYSGTKTGRGMSYYMLGGELSRTLGPLVITGAITLWGFEGTWRLVPFGIIASTILYFLLRGHSEPDYKPAAKEKLKRFPEIKQISPHLIFIGLFLIFFMGLKVLSTLYLTAFMVNRGQTLMAASLRLSILQLSGAAGTLLAGHLSDIIGKKATMLVSAVFSPLLLFAFQFAGPAGQFPILIGLGFVLFAPGPVYLAIIQDADADSPSFANGLYMTIQFAIRAGIVFLSGMAIDKIGFDRTYVIAIIAGLGTIPVVLFFPNRRVFKSIKND
ncbi:MAG: MFS transporter [Spirochaetales bacterium]|uniref:MFS transporter n=1 Tax=Candidatus Thalassospirochaeta sargassi TaxID=3119039 RepID=A0AAJ1IFF4_9SPIO|nr:MFS transporter [Spirochaetales bacterium]